MPLLAHCFKLSTKATNKPCNILDADFIDAQDLNESSSKPRSVYQSGINP